MSLAKGTAMASCTSFGRATRGATMVEVSLLTVAIVLGSVTGVRALGRSSLKAAHDGAAALAVDRPDSEGGIDTREVRLPPNEATSKKARGLGR